MPTVPAVAVPRSCVRKAQVDKSYRYSVKKKTKQWQRQPPDTMSSLSTKVGGRKSGLQGQNVNGQRCNTRNTCKQLETCPIDSLSTNKEMW